MIALLLLFDYVDGAIIVSEMLVKLISNNFLFEQIVISFASTPSGNLINQISVSQLWSIVSIPPNGMAAAQVDDTMSMSTLQAYL